MRMKETGMLKDVLQAVAAGEYCGYDKAICNSQEELDSWLLKEERDSWLLKGL